MSNNKPQGSTSLNGKQPQEFPIDVRPIGASGPGASVSDPKVVSNGPANSNEADVNGKKGGLSTRTSNNASGKSVTGGGPANNKNLLRKNSLLSGSNPLLVRSAQGKKVAKSIGSGGLGLAGKPPNNITTKPVNKQKQVQPNPTSNNHQNGPHLQEDGTTTPDSNSGCSAPHFPTFEIEPNVQIKTEVISPTPAVDDGDIFVIEMNGAGLSCSSGDHSNRHLSTTANYGDSTMPPLTPDSNSQADADMTVFGSTPTPMQISFVSPHLQFCNQHCSKLHFCLQNVPNPGLSTLTSSSVDYSNRPTSTGDVDELSLPVPGIREALNNLHGLRNFAVRYGLMNSTARYQGFAEIEAMLLEKVLQMSSNGSIPSQ